MTDVTRLLREADPARSDSPEYELSAADVLTIRREMLDALAETPALVPLWRRPITVGALAMVMLAVAGLTGHDRREAPQGAMPEDRLLAEGGFGGDQDRRQLQFSTPGGTRIIWIFDESLRLQESMP